MLATKYAWLGWLREQRGELAMKGVQFVFDDNGQKTAVVIDLKKHSELWEDFYDRALAQGRRREPRATLESVKTRLCLRAKRRLRG